MAYQPACRFPDWGACRPIARRGPANRRPDDFRTAAHHHRNDLGRVIIILDVTKIDGLDLRQIADYAAMVAFSQVDPDADTQDYDSILSLFGRPQTTPHLTEWDMTYLKALYKAELNQSAANQQAGEIQGLMARAQKRAQETAPEPD